MVSLRAKSLPLKPHRKFFPQDHLLRGCVQSTSRSTLNDTAMAACSGLIKQWLRAPVVEQDKGGTRRVLPNKQGTPQGGVISPLLANLDLNPLGTGWLMNAVQDSLCWCAPRMTSSS